MGATGEAAHDGGGGVTHALEAGDAAAAEVEKLLYNPLRRLALWSQARLPLLLPAEKFCLPTVPALFATYLLSQHETFLCFTGVVHIAGCA